MRNLIISFLLICFSYTINAQYDSAYLIEKIDTLLSQMPANDPGGTIAVVSGDKVLYQKAFGMMSMEYQLPNTNHTLFNLASVSKHFTAYCVLLLERDGKLNLDDDIHKYLPDLPKYKYKVSINDLIHHTSGIASTDNLRLFAGVPFESQWDADDEESIITRYSQLNFRPNEESYYSNSNYFLLAKIIEKVSGLSFSEYIKENIFYPLGMNESVVYDSPGKVILGKATGYKKEENSFARMNTEGESVYGSTNLYTSINDIVIWMQNLLNPKVRDKELVSRLFTPSHILNNGNLLEYTYGLNVHNYKGIKMAEHSGYAMGFRSQLMIFPEKNLAIITMYNNESIDYWKLTSKIADLYLIKDFIPEQKTERKEINLQNKSVLKNYAGKYRMTDGREVNFELSNDSLLVSLSGEQKYVMRAESETEFFVKEFDANCIFEIGSNGECHEIIWQQNNRQPKGIKVTSTISSDELQKYSGNYFNDPLDITYPVMFKNKQLYMVIPKSLKNFLGIASDVQLQYLEKDCFLTQAFGVVQFTRNNNHDINGFKIIDFGRVRNIEFKKKKNHTINQPS